MKTKKFLFILLLPILFVQGVKGQEFEFAPIGASWWYHFTGGWGSQFGYVLIQVENDTVINGFLSKKLSSKVFSHDDNIYDYASPFFLRSANDTVFYFANNQFHILYIFSDSIGTSWTSRNPYEIFGWPINFDIDTLTTYTIDSVSQQIYNDTILELLWVSSDSESPNCWGFYAPITKKIGCLHFMFPGQFCFWDPPVVGSLRCYSENSFYYSNFESCDSISTNMYEHHQNGTKIFPNPASDIINVVFNKNTTQAKLNLYDNFGCLVKSVNVENNDIQIDITKLKNGVFLIEIMHFNRNEIEIIKFIKL